jgi:hypothetical protein
MCVNTDKDISIRALQLFRLQNDQFWQFVGVKGAVHNRCFCKSLVQYLIAYLVTEQSNRMNKM